MNKKIFFVVPLVIFSLVTALYTGLLRLGWDFPINEAVAHHGALMVGSFLGSVIILERVVALKIKFLYVIPILSAFSGILFLLGLKFWALIFLLLGGTGLVIIYLILIERHKHYYFYIMLLGAVCWIIGNIFLLQGQLYAKSVSWWIVFILYTVLGERLELSKFMPPTRWKKPLLWVSCIILMTGLLMPYHGPGSQVTGLGFVLIALWLLKYDIIRKSIKVKGLHRYSASMLGAGYFWLLITGIFFMVGTQQVYMYDAAIHAFFMGFTFSMIFAHGPIIFPGVAGLPFKPFHNILYLLGTVLQLSLIIRICGDHFVLTDLRMVGGLLNAVIILLFFVTLVILIKREKAKYVVKK